MALLFAKFAIYKGQGFNYPNHESRPPTQAYLTHGASYPLPSALKSRLFGPIFMENTAHGKVDFDSYMQHSELHQLAGEEKKGPGYVVLYGKP